MTVFVCCKNKRKFSVNSINSYTSIYNVLFLLIASIEYFVGKIVFFSSKYDQVVAFFIKNDYSRQNMI